MRMDTKPRPRSGVLAQEAAGTLVLFNLQKGEYFSLEGVGEAVWGLCDGKRSVAEIAHSISQEYQQDLATVQQDVLDLLQQLKEEKLIENDE